MSDNPDRTDRRTGEEYNVLAGRDEIKQWADEHDMVPVVSSETKRPELARKGEVKSSQRKMTWETFLDEVEERNLVLAYDKRSDGEVTDCRLVGRSEIAGKEGEIPDSIERDLLEGETVTTEVTEREVIETEIVEEATIESKIIDTEIIDSETVGTEIIDEELVGVAVTERSDATVVDDDRRYFGDDDQAIQIEEDGRVALEIDETRVETEERIEKRIIESRVVDEDITEESTVEGKRLDVDIDTDSIHDHLHRSGLLDVQADQVIGDQHIETEFDDNNVATTTLTTHSTVENVIDERKVVFADISDVKIGESDLVSEEVIETHFVDSDTKKVADLDTDERRLDASREGTTATNDRGVEITGREMGRTVEMPDGTEIGMVSDVDEDAGVIYIDEEPSLTDKIKATLQWGEEEDASRLRADQIKEIRDDAVVVEGKERT